MPSLVAFTSTKRWKKLHNAIIQVKLPGKLIKGEHNSLYIISGQDVLKRPQKKQGNISLERTAGLFFYVLAIYHAVICFD